MLEFKKVDSSFAIAPDGSVMVVARFIDNKGYRLVFKLDGTIGALGAKVNQVCDMTNDDFKEFSLIQFAKDEDYAI